MRFEQCRTQATWTLPDHMSLFTSLLPSHHGVDNLNKVLPLSVLTLTESRMAVFLSNTSKPENRIQAEERIHRMGMDLNLGCEIVDIFHLPTDERVLNIVRENRRLELMTMGEVTQGVSWDGAED